MNYIQRALLYIRREKSRSLRLGLLFLILAVFLTLCSWVQISTESTADSLCRELGASFCLTDDGDGTFTNEALLEQICEQGNIRAVYGLNMQRLYSEDTPPVPGLLASKNQEGQYTMSYYSGQDSSLNSMFLEGTLTLIQGQHVVSGDTGKAVVSEDFAAQNNLTIGDTFTASYVPSLQEEYPERKDKTFSFQIVGLFHISKPFTGGLQAESSMLENAVFIDDTTGHMMDYNDESGSRFRYGITFFVGDPRELNQTVENALSLIDQDRFVVTVDDTAYQQSVEPLEQFSNLMFILIIVLTVAGIVVLALTLLLWIRQRTREIGIYLAIGFKKREVVAQFLIESLLTAVVSWLISVPVSLGLSGILSNMMDGMTPPPTLAILITVFVIMIGVASIATLCASLWLLRLKPRKILLQE